MKFRLGQDQLTSELFYMMANEPSPALTISDEVVERVHFYRNRVEEIIERGDTVYGLNTGFGYLANVAIPKENLKELQENLIRSHACGVGNPLPPVTVRGLLLLRLHTFCLGHSGVRLSTIRLLEQFIRHDILPVIPCQGSVGASGDLAPLAHLALALMGEGEVEVGGLRMEAREAIANHGLTPLSPAPKEGLSLINGTHLMTSMGALVVEQARTLTRAADIIAAVTIDALRGSKAPFDARIHQARPQIGQIKTAANMLALFQLPDDIMASHLNCDKVQDPYSLRCIPQVHGAVKDTLAHAYRIFNIELNSVTDNPLCFESGEVISGGNFHGQPLAMALDFVGIAMSELGSISERRTEKITNPALSGLPAFATQHGGLNSGFMIPHVVAAALASENKTLAVPASVDSIPTSADKEDHVSMGPIAARQAIKINRNLSRILAIEILAACQGLDLLKPLKPNRIIHDVYEFVRVQSPEVDRDRAMSQDIERIADLIVAGRLDEVVNAHGIRMDDGI